MYHHLLEAIILVIFDKELKTFFKVMSRKMSSQPQRYWNGCINTGLKTIMKSNCILSIISMMLWKQFILIVWIVPSNTWSVKNKLFVQNFNLLFVFALPLCTFHILWKILMYKWTKHIQINKLTAIGSSENFWMFIKYRFI